MRWLRRGNNSSLNTSHVNLPSSIGPLHPITFYRIRVTRTNVVSADPGSACEKVCIPFRNYPQRHLFYFTHSLMPRLGDTLVVARAREKRFWQSRFIGSDHNHDLYGMRFMWSTGGSVTFLYVTSTSHIATNT